MKHPYLRSRWLFKLTLGSAFTAHLCGLLSAGPGVTPTTQSSRPVTVQGQSQAKSPGAGPAITAKSAPAGSPSVDYGVFVPGKRVFSSGTADVIIQVLNSATVHPVPPGHLIPRPSPWVSGLYLLSPGQERFIASNKDAGKVINLGKLPPGELVFAVRAIDCKEYFRTGDGKENPDGLVHAEVRTFGSDSPIEIWFEDAPGPLGTGRSDRDFDDLVVSVSGGLDGGNNSNLAQAIQQQPAAKREALISELKKVDPKTAAAISSAAQPTTK